MEMKHLTDEPPLAGNSEQAEPCLLSQKATGAHLSLQADCRMHPSQKATG